MSRDRKAINKTIKNLTANRITRKEAARVLGVSLRTIQNYLKKYLDQGPEGLRDRRRGHFRKIEPEQETRILACKLDRPYCSARWVRDRLKLPVSVEAVRQVLLRHRLDHSSLGPRSRLSTISYKWDPF